MRINRLFPILPAVIVPALALLPSPAFATQGHGGVEGVYAHQMAHLFFAVSMGILIYWLRDRRLAAHPGWRYIQRAALFFILWNLDAFLAHLLEEQWQLIEVTRLDAWRVNIKAINGQAGLVFLYYLVKLDHLLCVPASLYLYLGLRRLLREAAPGKAEGGAVGDGVR
jgi:hypothetical protein